MPRVDSYTKSDMKKVLREHFRELQKYENSVDLSRSNQNIIYGNFHNAEEFSMAIQRRANTIMNGRDIQKQTNLMSEWCVSMPKDFKGNPKEFFDCVYQFYQGRYGAENVIGAFAHMDETNPHMHICFVPEATSRKTGNKTVSSASLLTRAELHECQQALDDCCAMKFGKHKMILTGKTKGDNLTVKQLKAQTEREQAIRNEYEQKLALLNEFMTTHNIKRNGTTLSYQEAFEEWVEARNKPVEAPVEQKPIEKPVEVPKKPVEAKKREIPTVEGEQLQEALESIPEAKPDASELTRIKHTGSTAYDERMAFIKQSTAEAQRFADRDSSDVWSK